MTLDIQKAIEREVAYLLAGYDLIPEDDEHGRRASFDLDKRTAEGLARKRAETLSFECPETVAEMKGTEHYGALEPDERGDTTVGVEE